MRHSHGTRGAYNKDACRCAACTAANAAAGRRHRRRQAQQAWNQTTAWAPALGTRRRLQALAGSGWSAARLAERLGVTAGAIANLRSTQQGRVLATTAAAVTRLYDDCWWRTPPGPSRDVARTETSAFRQNSADPSRWADGDLDNPCASPTDLPDGIDAVAVAEAVNGRRVPLTKAEQRAVTAELTRRGHSADETAAAIGRSSRTVIRQRRTFSQRSEAA